MSVFPFSVVEFCLYAGIILIIIFIIRIVKSIIKKKKRPAEGAVSLLRGFLLITGALFLCFTLGAGINYQNVSFAETEGFVIQPSTKEDLIALCEQLLLDVNTSAKEIVLDENGLCEKAENLGENAVLAMSSLGENYNSLSGYYPLAKPVLISKTLSVQKVTGVYSPFTIEANYNRDIPSYSLPFTLCHELSHLKGFMREEEANFIAWLACRNFYVPEFRYSAALSGYIYATNALYKYDKQTCRELMSGLCETAAKDIINNNRFWAQYDGAAANAHEQINDVYLKANSQASGVESYGEVVDLMIAYLFSQET